MANLLAKSVCENLVVAKKQKKKGNLLKRTFSGSRKKSMVSPGFKKMAKIFYSLETGREQKFIKKVTMVSIPTPDSYLTRTR